MHAHAGVRGEAARQRAERLVERLALERRAAQAADRAARLLEPFAGGAERAIERSARRIARIEAGEPGLDVEGDGGELLRQRVVDVARDARALVRSRMLDRPIGQARPFDRDADLVGDGGEQVELLPGQPAPAAHGEVHDADRRVAGIDRHAGVPAQPPRERGLVRFHRGGEPRALEDVDVARFELAAAEQLEAPARATRHAHRLLQIGRQALGGGAVELIGRGVAQPHPAGLDAEEIGHAGERVGRRALDGGRAVERLGDLLEDAQRAGARERPSLSIAAAAGPGHPASLACARASAGRAPQRRR